MCVTKQENLDVGLNLNRFHKSPEFELKVTFKKITNVFYLVHFFS